MVENRTGFEKGKAQNRNGCLKARPRKEKRLKCWNLSILMAELDWADFDLGPFGLVIDLPCRIRHVGSDVDMLECE
jgi:hypothetical protein